MPDALTTIAILGNDLEAWMAATVLSVQPYVRRPEIRIMTQVPGEQNTSIQAPLPGFSEYLARVGITTESLAKYCGAVPRMGTRYQFGDKNFTHIWGEYGSSRGVIEFHQLVAKAIHSGVDIDLNKLSVAAAAIAQGKYAHPTADPASIFSTFETSVSFSTKNFIELLAAKARAAGIIIDSRPVERMEFGQDGIVLRLASGQQLLTDYAINTSPLICSQNFEPWSDYLPYSCIERIAVAADTLDLAADVNFNKDSSWSVRHCIRSMSETLCYGLSTGGDGEGDKDPIACGYCPESRGERLLLMGKAAVRLSSPLVAEADLAWISLKALMKYFPSACDSSPVTKEYNDIVATSFRHLRDISQLVFELASRQQQKPAFGGRRLVKSEEIQHKEALFAYRGKIPFYENETIKPVWQTWLFLGLGLLPRCVDPIADRMAMDEVNRVMNAVLTAVKRESSALTKFV